jgi:hypothetical protein
MSDTRRLLEELTVDRINEITRAIYRFPVA